MPSAVARQLEYWGERYAPGADIKLTPVCLTTAQVQQYQLPRIPIKDSDLRKGRFEETYGAGAVELDALEALYPGELRRLLTPLLRPYYDRDLAQRFRTAEDEANQQVRAAWEDVTDDLQDEATEIEEEARAIYARYERILGRLQERLQRELAPVRDRARQLRQEVEAAQEGFEPPDL
jgi:hypothetical protein